MRPADAGGRWRPLPVALGLALLALALRAHDLGNPVLHVDEEYYLLVGDRWRHGARLYVDLWDRKPAGLFLIYAATRALPGDGVLAYQLAAAAFAAATGFLVALAARSIGAGTRAAIGAGAVYLLWLELLSGRGGQSPVFYDLFTTGAASLTLRLPRRATQAGIVASGAAACWLAGLAIQTKYTPVVEGAFFGCAHLWYLRRGGARPPTLIVAASGWIILGALPTLLVVGWFRRHDPAGFGAFWFANFVSITLRHGYPAAKIAARLAGIGATLLPLVVTAVAGRRGVPAPERRLATGWLAAATIAFAMIGAFFDHYALPLVAPLAILGAGAFDRHRRALPIVLGYGGLLFGFKLWVAPDERGSARAVAAVMAAHRHQGCPYVFAGDAALYLLSRTCVPTPYAFPSTLAFASERGAAGIDEAREVARVMAARPPVVVTMDVPMGTWNPASVAIVRTALNRDYALALSVPREGRHMLAYIRRSSFKGGAVFTANRVTSAPCRPAAPIAGAAASPASDRRARTDCPSRTGCRPGR